MAMRGRGCQWATDATRNDPHKRSDKPQCWIHRPSGGGAER